MPGARRRTIGSTAAAVLAGAAIIGAWSCASLRESRTNWPIKEYEKIIAGRLDADYVGNAACTAKCHAHDALTRDFRLSIHGEQVAAGTNAPLVNCESCHGPGSLAVANIVDGACDSSTFIDIKNIPAGARSLICLKCHSGQSLPILSGWAGGRHAAAEVSCPDCHQLHRGPQQKVERREVADLCFRCHEDTRVAFSLPSHHPVREGIVSCVDCHNPHGTGNDANLLSSPVRTVCARCHAEKTGPFVYEHADHDIDCQTCHQPHGSTNTRLLAYAQPFLCLQCHQGHNTARRPALQTGSPEAKAVFFGECTRCHTRIHGSDLPGFRNDDRFTR
jgi:DmsE family decaheme c-type cytochrome